MKNNKKLKTILLVGALTANFCLPISAYAGEDRVCPAGLLASELEKNTIQPRFQYTNSVSVELDFTGYKALGRVIVEGKSSATKITGTLKLQKKNTSGTYSTVKTWSNIGGEGKDLIYEVSPSVSSTGTYRLSFSGKVYSGTKYENVSGYLDAICD